MFLFIDVLLWYSALETLTTTCPFTIVQQFSSIKPYKRRLMTMHITDIGPLSCETTTHKVTSFIIWENQKKRRKPVRIKVFKGLRSPGKKENSFIFFIAYLWVYLCFKVFAALRFIFRKFYLSMLSSEALILNWAQNPPLFAKTMQSLILHRLTVCSRDLHTPLVVISRTTTMSIEQQ